MDNFSSPAYASPGIGSTLPETFTFRSPTDPTAPIHPGELVLVRSNQTGMYCRVANVTSPSAAGASGAGGSGLQGRHLLQPLTSAAPGMICDVANPEDATNFTWTGSSIDYSGAPLTAAPVSITNPTPPATFSRGNASFVALPHYGGSPAPANALVTIQTASGCLAVDNAVSPVYLASPCSGTSTTERFIMQPTNGSTRVDSILPGEKAIIKSVETGMYCRMATLDDGQQGVLCDVSSIDQATPLLYTGAGLRYNGAPLASAGAGQPLLRSPGAPTPTSTLAVQPVGPPALPGRLPSGCVHKLACGREAAVQQVCGCKGRCHRRHCHRHHGCHTTLLYKCSILFFYLLHPPSSEAGVAFGWPSRPAFKPETSLLQTVHHTLHAASESGC